MLVILSGEGPTDLGVCRSHMSMCDGEEFLRGPLAVIVGDLLTQKFKGQAETARYAYIHKRELSVAGKSLPNAKKGMRLPGKRRSKETGFYFSNSRALAQLAVRQRDNLGEKTVVAILFRDADGTASSGRGEWDAKFQSMLDGFAEQGFMHGVPMLPKPKSEAWLLCALKSGIDCHNLENESGNDASPNSLKRQLATHPKCGAGTGREELCKLVKDGVIFHENIKMSSFERFRARLEEVLELVSP